MGLSQSVRQEVTRRIEQYEGRVNHLYRDSEGFVTVGVGHLVASRSAVRGLPLFVSEHGRAGRTATDDEKLADYDAVLRQPRRLHHARYRPFTRLIMREADIDLQRDGHLTSFHRELRAIYRRSRGYPFDFDTLPPPGQKALFDMIFNLGAVRIVRIFTKFDRALKAGDWEQAAKESYRHQLGPERNAYVRSQLMLMARMTQQQEQPA